MTAFIGIKNAQGGPREIHVDLLFSAPLVALAVRVLRFPWPDGGPLELAPFLSLLLLIICSHQPKCSDRPGHTHPPPLQIPEEGRQASSQEPPRYLHSDLAGSCSLYGTR